MQRKLILTSDGSHTILLQELNVTYHSIHGAVQESKHVFIEAGLKNLVLAETAQLNIFEVGFGTGLNALLTIIEAEKLQTRATTRKLRGPARGACTFKLRARRRRTCSRGWAFGELSAHLAVGTQNPAVVTQTAAIGPCALGFSNGGNCLR